MLTLLIISLLVLIIFLKRNALTGSIFLCLLISGGFLSAQSVEGLFKRDTSMARRSADANPTGGTILLLDENLIQQLIATKPDELTLTLPSDELGNLTLQLKKRQLFTEDFKASSSGNNPISVLDLHYTGVVKDHPLSKAALSLTEEAVSGLIQLESKVIALRRLNDDATNDHVIYDYSNHPEIGELDCSSTDTMPGYETTKLSRTSTIGEPVCVAIRVEVDQDFRGDAAALLNQVASIYQEIGVEIKVTEIYYWDTPSPYTGTTKEIITKMRQSLVNYENLSGDLTLLLAGKGNGGRAAAVGAVCDPSIVCYSGQNDDVYTVAHELGHLFAAHHTHACKWNGNNTALDGCGYNAGYGGCAGEDPSSGGTIMSYCHVRSVGINLKFHPQVANVMYNYLKDNSGCTCQPELTSVSEIVEEVEEEEEFEEVDGGGTNENITANICQMSLINPNNCSIEIYALNNNVKSDLLITINANGSINTPVIKSFNYGIYSNGVLLDQFTAECGAVFSVPACGTEGERVNGRLYLEGFYDAYSGKMHQTLLEQSLLSKTNPYLQAPWNYKGITSVTTIPSNAVDWILIMSRDVTGTVLGQSVGFLNTDGQLMDVYGGIGIPIPGANGQHISIHHRGHMAVMTATPYQRGAIFDISAIEGLVLGNGQLKQIGNIYALHAGDFDANGVINNMDYNHWVSNSSKINQYIPSDGDGNGVINNKDYNLWISNRSKIGHMPLHY